MMRPTSLASIICSLSRAFVFFVWTLFFFLDHLAVAMHWDNFAIKSYDEHLSERLDTRQTVWRIDWPIIIMSNIINETDIFFHWRIKFNKLNRWIHFSHHKSNPSSSSWSSSSCPRSMVSNSGAFIFARCTLLCLLYALILLCGRHRRGDLAPWQRGRRMISSKAFPF